MCKIILTTGGTGGHIFPALATAEALREIAPGSDIIFIGSTYGPEGRMALKAGVPFIGLPGRGILGRGIRAIPAAASLAGSVLRAIGHMRSYRPDVIAAFGGYASFAPALAAKLLRLPLLLHEQNAVAGASNRLLGKWADTLCASLPDTSGFPDRYIVTGNPVRSGLKAQAGQSRGKSKNLLVLGGSQGAHSLNRYIVNLLPKLKSENINILHQTGDKDHAWVIEAYERAGLDCSSVKPFIEDMADAYAWADLAFCRSGASTVAELCATGVGALLVPFPAAIHDHQTLNARAMAANGAAELIPEGSLDGEGAALLSLLRNPAKLASMSRAALQLAKPEAARAVAREILKLARLRRK